MEVYIKTDGYYYHRTSLSNQVVFVTTVSRHPPQKALSDNLSNAIKNLSFESISGSDRIWLPLMGTGSAGLDYFESLRITFRVLSELRLIFAKGDITLSLHSDFPKDLFVELPEIAQEFFENVNEVRRFSDDSSLQADRSVISRDRDTLNRAVIADVLAKNIAEIWPEHRKNNWPFMIHISGRWGSGKSTVLNFLKENLENNPLYCVEFEEDKKKYQWIIADYNAWLEAQNEKTWWALLNSVINAINTKYMYFSNWTWWTWRRWQHWIFSGIILSVFVLLTSFILTKTDGGKDLDLLEVLQSLLVLLTTLGALLAIFNKLSPNAQKTSQAIVELDSKPLAPLTKRYHEIVAKSKNPIAIFIDDLDRCEAEYVVGVLQSVQTAYANTPVLYIVAADRDWIVSAYEQKYSSFKDALAKPGQPLGYLFLKKIFQMSINIPDLSSNQKDEYLNELLKVESSRNDGSVSGKGKDITNTDEGVKTPFRTENMSKIVDEATKKVEIELEKLPHRLNSFTDIMEANPRSVKRLINTYGFRYLYSLQANLNIEPDDLVVWSILDQRFPFVAQKVLQDPDLLDQLNDIEAQDEILSDPKIIRILSKLNKISVLKIRQIS